MGFRTRKSIKLGSRLMASHRRELRGKPDTEGGLSKREAVARGTVALIARRALLLSLVSGFLIGCGSSESDDDNASRRSSSDQTTTAGPEAPSRRQAEAAVVRVATPIANRVTDRYLQGPKKIRAKCEGPENDAFKCTATGYARPQANWRSSTAPYSVAIADEDWIVPIRRDGRVGKPRPGEDAYGIGDFLEADNLNGCSAGKSLNC